MKIDVFPYVGAPGVHKYEFFKYILDLYYFYASKPNVEDRY